MENTQINNCASLLFRAAQESKESAQETYVARFIPNFVDPVISPTPRSENKHL